VYYPFETSSRLLFVFTTTNYKRIEGYLFEILGFECIKISQISGFPKGATVAHYHKNAWETANLKFTTATYNIGPYH